MHCVAPGDSIRVRLETAGVVPDILYVPVWSSSGTDELLVPAFPKPARSRMRELLAVPA